MEMLENGYSGRRFVLVAGIVVLLIWAALYLVFRDWRAKYRERSLYGTTQVVPGDRATPAASAAQGRSGCLARRR